MKVLQLSPHDNVGLGGVAGGETRISVRDELGRNWM